MNILTRNENNDIPLHHAKTAIEIFNLSGMYNKNLFKIKNNQGNTPLHLFSKNMFFEIYDLEDMLITNNKNETFTHIAVKNSNKRLLDNIILNKDLVKIQDVDGNTIFHLACLNNNEEYVVYNLHLIKYMKHLKNKNGKTIQDLLVDKKMFVFQL